VWPLRFRSKRRWNHTSVVTGTIEPVWLIIMHSPKLINRQITILKRMKELSKLMNIRLNLQSWWEKWAYKWMLDSEYNVKKPVCIWTQGKIKLLNPTRHTFHPRCGQKSVNKPHCTFNAEYVLGLLVKGHMNLEKWGMIKMLNWDVDKRNSKRKKNKRGKSKFKGECILRNRKILTYYTMNLKPGDWMKQRKSKAPMNWIMTRRILLYNNYWTRKRKSCNKLTDWK